MPGIDLHVHTAFSDGTFTPREVLALARVRELGTIAITDHDTTAGLPEAFEAGTELGVEGIPGIEFAYLTKADIVLHPLVQRIVDVYEKRKRN